MAAKTKKKPAKKKKAAAKKPAKKAAAKKPAKKKPAAKAKKKPAAKAKKKAASKKKPAKKAKKLTRRNFKWQDGLVGKAKSRKQPYASMDEVEAAHIKSVLAAYGHDIQRTGLALGIARSTVYRKMKRYGLT